METRFLEYIEKIKTGDYKPAIKICWLYPDETIESSFTEAMYDISGSINVTYQQGTRRTCSLTINNKNGQFPIDYNHIWIGQKFQVWAGVYLNDGTPYYISQGIFYILNPKDIYNPTNKTINIQGTDKWAFLDGNLFGYLTGLYSQTFGTNLKNSIMSLLNFSKYSDKLEKAERVIDQIDVKNVLVSPYFETATREKTQYYKENGGVIYSMDVKDSESGKSEKKLFIMKLEGDPKTYVPYEIQETAEEEYILGDKIEGEAPLDRVYTKEENVLKSPYTIKIASGKTYGDYLKEVGTILAADVYYDNFGYLRLEPLSIEVDNLSNDDKIIDWNFFDNQKDFLGFEQDNNFTNIYNDIVVLGKVINGYQAKARIQNRNSLSDTNIYEIGVKTKPPYEDDAYYTDSLCLDLAKYYARLEMAMEKKTTIKCLPMYHLDVNHLITLTVYDKNIINEKFLINSYSVPLGRGTMSISCNNIRNFSKWSQVNVYG